MPISTSPASSTGTAHVCPVCGAPADINTDDDGWPIARCIDCKTPWVPLDEWNSDALVVVPPSEGPSARSLFEQSKARLAVIAKEGSPVWGELRKEVEKLAPRVESLTVTSADETEKITLAADLHAKLREVRLAAEKQHKALKRDIIDRGNAIDAAKNEIFDVVKPLEQRALEMKEFAKRKAAAETEARQQEREEILRDLVDNPETLPLAAMSEEEFMAMRDFYEGRKMAKLDAERKAAAEEADRVKRDADEREAQRLENERLRKEAAEQERERTVERQQQAAKAAEHETARKAAAAEHERTLASERATYARAVKAAEDKARLQAIADAAEAEARSIRESNDIVEAKIRRQQAAEQAARERAATAPDREKLLACATALEAAFVAVPLMTTTTGGITMIDLGKQVDELAAWVRSRAETL